MAELTYLAGYSNEVTETVRQLIKNGRLAGILQKKYPHQHEIRIGSVFKKAPQAFLNMIIVHELAHLREKDHNKAFYKLCQYMAPDYHQLEFDCRLYLTCLELRLIDAGETSASGTIANKPNKGG